MGFHGEKRKDYEEKRYKERKEFCLEYLGSKCVSCGSINNLQIDHVDPKTRSFIVTHRLRGAKMDLIKQELDKCQLLCQNCHTDKTLKDNGQKRAEHGNANRYRKHKCRCELCRKAKSIEHRRFNKKK